MTENGNGRTKRDMIAGELRTLILSGELQRETRMQQDELARRFNSSITPVREALGVLAAEGLVVSEPHRGVRVAPVDLERLKSIYVARRLLETYAVRRAVSRMSPRDVAAAEALLVEIDRANAEGRTTAEIRQLNRRFHFFLYDRCGLKALVTEIENLWRLFPWDLNLAEVRTSRAPPTSTRRSSPRSSPGTSTRSRTPSASTSSSASWRSSRR
jgi:DNA-binding GntR family transcriptional regulator